MKHSSRTYRYDFFRTRWQAANDAGYPPSVIVRDFLSGDVTFVTCWAGFVVIYDFLYDRIESVAKLETMEEAYKMQKVVAASLVAQERPGFE